MDFTLQEMLLALLPMWNYRISKPFKQFLDGEVSLEMYYCIQTLRWCSGTLTMSELAHYTRMPKQQMTKMVNRLIELQFVKRIYDPADRRIIKIQITHKAEEYIRHFLETDAGCFQPLLQLLDTEDTEKFKKALDLLYQVLSKIPCDWNEQKEDDSSSK